MSVECLNTESMVNFHENSQLRVGPDCCDTSLSRSLNWCIGSSSNIQAVMPSWFFGEWRNPWSKPGGYPALHRPDGRSCGPSRGFLLGSQGQLLKRLFLDCSFF